MNQEQSQPQEGAKEQTISDEIMNIRIKLVKGRGHNVSEIDHLLYKLDLKVSDLLSHPDTPIQQPEQPVKKPLETLTDGDAIKVAKIVEPDERLKGWWTKENGLRWAIQVIDGVDVPNAIRVYQYLEHRGYELPRYYPQPVQPAKEGELDFELARIHNRVIQFPDQDSFIDWFKQHGYTLTKK